MLARLPAQMLERGVGPRERLARELVAELEIDAFQEERIVIENENRGRMVKRSHDKLRPRRLKTLSVRAFRTTVSYRIRYVHG